MNIGENIRKIRREKGITQKQLGEKIGVSQAAIGQFENNKDNFKVETIEKIATALGVDPFSLYSFDMASKVLETGMNQKENNLLDSYRQLNDSGQDKATNYVEDLTKIPEYQKDPREYPSGSRSEALVLLKKSKTTVGKPTQEVGESKIAFTSDMSRLGHLHRQISRAIFNSAQKSTGSE